MASGVAKHHPLYQNAHSPRSCPINAMAANLTHPAKLARARNNELSGAY
jgi:hypothetical protein